MKAIEKLGAWLSAALEDDKVCGEMKADIRNWFDFMESHAAKLKRVEDLLEEATKALPRFLPNNVEETYLIIGNLEYSIREALALLRDDKPKCQTCKGTGVSCDDEDMGGDGCTNSPCPDCKGTGREPKTKKLMELIEPSNAELAELPSCSYQYILGLETNIDHLTAENKELKEYEVAVKKRHNGYDPEVCKELGVKPPASPEQALQELQDEWASMEDGYAEQIAKLTTEQNALRELLIKYNICSKCGKQLSEAEAKSVHTCYDKRALKEASNEKES
jgi:hypothetical protein